MKGSFSRRHVLHAGEVSLERGSKTVKQNLNDEVRHIDSSWTRKPQKKKKKAKHNQCVHIHCIKSFSQRQTFIIVFTVILLISEERCNNPILGSNSQMLNWPLPSSEPPLTPGSTAGSRGCCRSWGWSLEDQFWPGWTAPAAGLAAVPPPGCCWGYVASPCHLPAAVAQALPLAAAAAPAPSVAGSWSDTMDNKENECTTEVSTSTGADQVWFLMGHTFILCRCSSFSFSCRPMLSLVLQWRETSLITEHFQKCLTL